MATGTLITEAEYLHTSYEHDPEFEDGVVIERGMPTAKHGEAQVLLAAYLVQRKKEWKLTIYTELTFKIRTGKYMIPDIAVVSGPKVQGPYGTEPPLIWIEILSPDDRHVRVNQKVQEVLAYGAPFVWVIDPETLESELHTRAGVQVLEDGVLRIPGTPIEVPLSEVLKDLAAL